MEWRRLRSGPSGCYCCRPLDFGVGENVVFVVATGGKLGDYRTLIPRLEPVGQAWPHRVLIARVELDFLPHLEIFGPPGQRRGVDHLRTRSINIDVHFAPPTAKCFLFPRIRLDRWMKVLGASLPWEHRQFLGAVAPCVNIDKYREPNFRVFTQAEIRNFDLLFLSFSDNKSSSGVVLQGKAEIFFVLFLIDHALFNND